MKKGTRRNLIFGLMAIIAVMLFVWALKRAPNSEIKTLSNMVLILDPGHGNEDSGAWCTYAGDTATEAATAYEIGQRVKLHAEEQGATVYSTVYDGPKMSDISPSYMKNSLKEKFSLDGSLVTSDSIGLYKRVRFGAEISKRHPDKLIVWISPHFDELNSYREGIRIIYPSGLDTLLTSLDSSFKAVGYIMQIDQPFLENNSTNYKRNLVVLRNDANPIRDKVLIEFGNTQNPADCQKMIDPVWREKYAQRLVTALEYRLSKRAKDSTTAPK